MKKIIWLVMAFFFIAALTGCSGYPIKVGTVDQKVDTADVDFSKGRSISASAGGFQLLLFIPISVNSRHERAYQRLKEKAGYDYITDIRIRESWTYWLVGSGYTTTIEATAYARK